jgi:hypothetical protein
MWRRFSILLIVCSLLAQLAGGVLPNGRMCGCAPVEEERCSCCVEKERAAARAPGYCPCPVTCPKCEIGQPADNRLVPGEAPRMVAVHVDAELTPCTGPAPPVVAAVARVVSPHPRVNESPPPHLASLNTTVLLL